MLDLKTFKQQLQQTSYYKNMFNCNETILGIYILGSQATQILDERSDIDIVILIKDGCYRDMSDTEYLTYNGVKVHWYYAPISQLFDIDNLSKRLSVLTALQFHYLRPELIIYENNKYLHILQYLYNNSKLIFQYAAYGFYNQHKDYINKLLNQRAVFEEDHTKFLYHLCLVSDELNNICVDRNLLLTLKRIRWQPVPETYKQAAIIKLENYLNYIQMNPCNYQDKLHSLFINIPQEEGVIT